MRPTSQFNTFTISEASKIIGNIPEAKKVFFLFYIALSLKRMRRICVESNRNNNCHTSNYFSSQQLPSSTI